MSSQRGGAWDAVVVGGGFYGAVLALYLKVRRRLPRVLLIEREASLLSRASYGNQARVHNGYHYPRSYTTAFRSRANLPHFVRDFPSAVQSDFTKLYAIARHDTKVTANQFERFCRAIGAAARPAEKRWVDLFDRRLIEAVFEVEEFAFDATKLAAQCEAALRANAVEIGYGCKATAVARRGEAVELTVKQGAEASTESTSYVFNCTYAGLNSFGASDTELKREFAEIALVKPPAVLQRVGITIMDGPFFSIMPFPARSLHSFTHVRYTPHRTLRADSATKTTGQSHSRFDRMQRDARRLLPVMEQCEHVESIFEVKALLPRNEVDDGRPILLERSLIPGVYSILGGKIDNIYDVLHKLDEEPLRGGVSASGTEMRIDEWMP
ncbi:FAD-dependent oxidoreductase [Pseudomarimonas arenosa]|uniref:FAD-binding oxidoreductase n=1 Tax=Pseudomarimonas arenosa TaxID=2774145 RepID=A0AAW3ZJL4_9GAMM|nr:FAD-binding oxidoreductase [Pseudomarimonas arenosa]